MGMTEINLEEQQRKIMNQDGEIEMVSLDSEKIRGADESIDEEIDDEEG